jgi:hypothetical protein
MKTKLLILVCFLASNAIVLSQGTFQDLNFEDAVIARLGTGYSAASAFPGWQVLIGTTPTSVVGYDGLSIGAPAIAIIDDLTGYVPIDGNYTAYLMASSIPDHSGTASLAQTGTIPAGTQSIELDANQATSSSFAVTVNGNTINMTPVETYPGYTLYGGNVSAWSGQTATLSITELEPSNPQFSPSLLQLDDITFSTTAVPEPDSILLTGIGGLIFAGHRLRLRCR